MAKPKETKLEKIVPNIKQESRGKNMMFFKCSWPSKVFKTPERISKNRMSKSLQKMGTNLPQIAFQMDFRNCPCRRLRDPRAVARVVPGCNIFEVLGLHSLAHLAQIESNHLLAHFLQVFLHFKPNLTSPNPPKLVHLPD